MARRKHDTGEGDGYRPFRALAGLVKEAGIGLRPEEKPGPEKPEAADPEEVPVEAADEELFARAMTGVSRVKWRHDPTASPPSPRVSPPSVDPDLEGLRLMQDAVDGIPAPTVPDHPEYIEGWVGVAGKRFLPYLRNGMYSIQAQIDLHGLTREEARRAAEEFLIRMSRLRPCCVKVIHGRGINSPNDRPVLKEELQRWLSTRRMSRHVVAYASAPFTDGGVGAVYVLLRRAK